MASNTKKLKIKRKLRRLKMGKARKRLLRRGTTPSLPIHVDRPDQEAKPQA